jgi:golgi resident protein GCP60
MTSLFHQRQQRIRLQEEERAMLEQKRLDESAAEQRRQQQASKQAAAQAKAEASAAASAPAPASTPGEAAGAVVAPTGAELVAKFKATLADSPDFKIDVARGEVVRVRVPNRVPGSTRLLWNFCSEQYDIGFGLDFEVQTADGGDGDVKVETLLPVDRKASHQELCSGSHVNPVPGNWLLVFDNSYSILRSKQIYYLCDLK